MLTMPNKPIETTIEVDARGLDCPMPLLKAKLALNGCSKGQVVRVLATDAGSVRDFHAFAELSAHALLRFNERDDYFEYHLEKGEYETVSAS